MTGEYDSIEAWISHRAISADDSIKASKLLASKSPLARNEALEEAAKLVEARMARGNIGAFRHIAAAIRALKEKTP